MKPLTPTELKIAALVADGLGQSEIVRRTGKCPTNVKNRLRAIYTKLQVDDPGFHPHVRLGVYLNCELFQIGLRELKLAS